MADIWSAPFGPAAHFFGYFVCISLAMAVGVVIEDRSTPATFCSLPGTRGALFRLLATGAMAHSFSVSSSSLKASWAKPVSHERQADRQLKAHNFAAPIRACQIDAMQP